MNNYFHFIVVAVLGFVVSRPAFAVDPADTYPDLHLIPWPKSLQRHELYLELTADSRIVAGNEQLKPLAEILSDEIATLTGLKLKVASGESRAGDIVLTINSSIQAGDKILMLRNREPVRTTDGAHTIAIDRQAVVEGFDYRATAEGSSTLLQLLGKTQNGARLPRVNIKDWPHADYCGVMLDVGRQDHPIDAIKKVVQICRMYKARYLQLHLTDDQGWTFPSTKYPKLGSKNYGAHGGIAPRVYKLEDLKDLVAYADSRGVTIIPELEMPGHSGAALRSMPEIFDAINPQSKQPVGMGCMNMSNEEIYPALDILIGEMCDVFRSSPYFHIGSDEVTMGRLSLHPGYKAFMAKHGLKDDYQLADHFIREMCALVKKHGKKAIKWEGLSNTATKDVIIMAWDNHSNIASEMQPRGYTTITCPWDLGVPWEQWNMYVCNASRLKRGDSVLGATLVAWEQPPLFHITSLRNLPTRQERTWGPDNTPTAEGFAARFQPLDAAMGKLLDMQPKPQFDAKVSTSLTTSDFLEPVFAFDGSHATFFKSASAPKRGDHFTLTFPKPVQIYAIEVLTGVNHHGLLPGGELQVSNDGSTFSTVGTIENGAAKAVLKSNDVQAVRILVTADQTDPLVIRAINLRKLVNVAGVVSNPAKFIGDGNVAVTSGDAEFTYPIGSCASPVINRDFTLKLRNGGNAYQLSGPITGSGKVEIYAAGPNAPLTLDGKLANTMSGTWSIQAGQVVLAKQAGAVAMGGKIIVAGGSPSGMLIWHDNNQLADSASVQLLSSEKGAASLNINGFSNTIAGLSLAAGCKVMTDGPHGGGVLKVQELTVDGKRMPKGIYTPSASWLQGSGYVIVGDVKQLEAAGVIDAIKVIGAGNIAVLKSATTFKIPDGECSVSAVMGNFPLTLVSEGEKSSYSGLITGNGALRIEASEEQPLEIAGANSNSFKGQTTLARGALKLNKPVGAIAIPGNLVLGGSAPENKKDVVIWNADGQIAPSATVTVQGDQSAFLYLNGHKVTFANLIMGKAGTVLTGNNGTLHLKQLIVNGERLKDGTYDSSKPWLKGNGTIVVDSRVNISGTIGSPEAAIGHNNIGNLTGDTKFGYPSSGGDYDILTNGFTLTLDSGDGNAFAFSGGISGTGNVVFLMGPSYTGFRDAPMHLNGKKPNTTTGKFLVKKGRVSLAKPEGVDAISGDAIVGGQGFNDCLFWENSHQLKDTVNITLLDAGNSGAAYLHLNGCSETANSLTMTVNNKVLTDSAKGQAGELTVKSLTIGRMVKPAGIYGAATEKWIEGKGKVIVKP